MFFNHSFKLAVVLFLLMMVAVSGCATLPAKPAAEVVEPVANVEPVVVEQAATQAEMEAQVREANSAWEDAYQAGDLDRLMALYADDAVSMPPNLPMIEGKAAIEADYRQFFEEFTVDRQFSLMDLAVAGDLAVRRGEWTQTFTPKVQGEPITEVGRCQVVFKRIGGEWLIETEIWNTVSVTGGEPAAVDAAVPEADLKAQVEKAVWAFEDAYQAGDLDRIIALYADDAVSLPPGFPKTEGKTDLEASFREFFDTFTMERDFKLVNVDVFGDKATRLGEWTQTLTPKAGGDPIVETGRCILGYKKVGDEWLIAWEIWNTY